MRLAQERLDDNRLTTFVSSDDGLRAQFLAIDASKVLVDLGLLSRPQTANCRPATGETIGKAKACWAGGTVQIYLNLAGRDPTSVFQQVAATDEAAVVEQIKNSFLALVDPNDWNGDDHPEGWDVIDRAFTKAEARYIPNGPAARDTTDMAHPTRTGDVVVFSRPPYQFDAATPGTLVALSAFFGQHGYVPDLPQDFDSNTNIRATFLAGGNEIRRGEVKGVRSIDLAPTAASCSTSPCRSTAKARWSCRCCGGETASSRSTSSVSTTSTGSSTRPRRRSTAATCPWVAPPSWPRCSTRRRPSSRATR